MSTLRFLFSGTMANLAGIGMSATAQIVSVPVLTGVWGVERYGIWLMLTSIPTYFALSDLGFPSAATSQMTMQATLGKRAEALATFQSVGLLLIVVSLALSLSASLALWSPLADLTPILDQNRSLIEALLIYSALAMNSRTVLAGFRATGHYAFGNVLQDSLTLLETFSMLAAAYMGADFLFCVWSLISFRLLNIVICYVALRRKVSWLYLGLKHASLTQMKSLAKPALAATAIPMALAANLQGSLLVVGMTLSAIAVAHLAPVRTASRVIVQAIGALNRATMPLASAANARLDSRATAHIMAINIATLALMLIPGAVLFAFCGSTIVAFWTHGKVQPTTAFVALMAAGTVLHATWFFVWNLLLASNSHARSALWILVANIGATALAVPAVRFCGLNGMAVMICLSEALCLYKVLREASIVGLLDWAELKTIPISKLLRNLHPSRRSKNAAQ